jgi:hypothetical protein
VPSRDQASVPLGGSDPDYASNVIQYEVAGTLVVVENDGFGKATCR